MDNFEVFFFFPFTLGDGKTTLAMGRRRSREELMIGLEMMTSAAI